MAPDIDGVLGVSTYQDDGPSYVEMLVDSGVISRKMMALYIGEEDSHVTFGDYNATLVQGGDSGIAWLDTTNETEWETQVTAGFFGDKELFRHAFK